MYEYTFSAELTGQPTLVRRGYGDTKTWAWTPNAFEGTFTIGAKVKNTHAGTSASTSTSYTLTPALVNGHAGIHAHQSPASGVFQYKVLPGSQLYARPLHAYHCARGWQPGPADD